jgi:Predicted membrane protein (DUF2238)
MKQELPQPEKEFGEDLKTFEELPARIKELALLQHQAEKATGPASVVLNKVIREKARGCSEPAEKSARSKGSPSAASAHGLGQSYLGTQGDEWDAHKDMALASLGALLAMSLTAATNWRLQRDFAREWGESLRVKQKAPLGEDELARMARKQKSP